MMFSCCTKLSDLCNKVTVTDYEQFVLSDSLLLGSGRDVFKLGFGGGQSSPNRNPGFSYPTKFTPITYLFLLCRCARISFCSVVTAVRWACRVVHFTVSAITSLMHGNSS